MAKRGYKLQEFVAHAANVNCLSIGKKACRLFLTGGDDYKVNLWAIGKPNSLMSLCGHTSPVESLAFDSAEVLVLAGASSGVIKLWDLEEAKMVRGLTGHRSNCTAVEFHPFGEFFASGSMDTNLKIWDIRKKGCIHTYKGHTRGISTIRFTPDGRWVVSGGYDNVVKVWDLTAGKLLHDFKFHENHIRSIDFHPLEFLLATGSADRTVKFWDLETFELIGSSRPEATGVRSMAFHPDGRTLFCGLDDSLKVYSWEPVICHDTLDMGWSSLGDLCIHDGKFLGCSYYQSSVGVWVADISLIEPHGANLKHLQNDCAHDGLSHQGSHSTKVGTTIRTTSILHCGSPDYESKEIKTIYVDTAGENPVSSQRVSSRNSAKVSLPLDSMDTHSLNLQRQGPMSELPEKSNEQGFSKSSVLPNVVTRDGPDEKDASRRESVTFSRTKPGMLLRPSHSRRPSTTKNDFERLSISAESEVLTGTKSGSDSTSKTNVSAKDEPRESYEENHPSVKNVSEKVDMPPVQTPKTESCDQPISCKEGTSPVKFVNGVAVVQGRTRTLVEKFERRERLSSSEDLSISTPPLIPQTDKTPPSVVENLGLKDKLSFVEDKTSMSSHIAPIEDQTPSAFVYGSGLKERSRSTDDQSTVVTSQRAGPPDESSQTPPPVENLDRKDGFSVSEEKSSISPSLVLPVVNKASTTLRKFGRRDRFKGTEEQPTVVAPLRGLPKDELCKSPLFEKLSRKDGINVYGDKATSLSSHPLPVGNRTPSTISRDFGRRDRLRSVEDQTVLVPQRGLTAEIPVIPVERFERQESSVCTGSQVIQPPTIPVTTMRGEPQFSGRESDSANDEDVTEVLMGSHEVFLSTLRSRLTKLQVVRHFFERKDMKGAINALRKLPDHSVQADVVSILMDKMEMLNLDLFSCLLPVLVGLLDSKLERHTCVSLEMLLKLVAVFGQVVRSAVSAPPAIGVDLHAEQRLECCIQCNNELQKIQKILPLLVRRGGLVAKSAHELNLVLQQ